MFTLFKKRNSEACFLLIWAGTLISATNVAALSPPPTVSNRALGQNIRVEIEQIRTSYMEGRISRPVANHRTASSFAKALSPGGQRFQREFPRGVHLDFMRNDISRVVNNALSGNKTNWHGFYRELKFINAAIAPGASFELVEAGSRQVIRDGRVVEFDSLFRERRTGKTLVIEIKDWKISSRDQLDKAKDQILKISQRAREEGVTRATWMNRQQVPGQFRSELVDFGRRHNVGIYDRVTTGQTAVQRGQAQHIDDVLRRESRNMTRAERVGRVNRVIPYLAVIVETGFMAHKTSQWQAGRATTRDLAVTSGGAVAGVTGAAGGAILGAKGGAAIGTFFGPGIGTAIGGTLGGLGGAVVGGVSGHFGGRKATEYAIDKFYYEKLSEEEKRATVEALIAHFESMTNT